LAIDDGGYPQWTDLGQLIGENLSDATIPYWNSNTGSLENSSITYSPGEYLNFTADNMNFFGGSTNVSGNLFVYNAPIIQLGGGSPLSSIEINNTTGFEGDIIQIVGGYPVWASNSLVETDPKVGTLTNLYLPMWVDANGKLENSPISFNEDTTSNYVTINSDLYVPGNSTITGSLTVDSDFRLGSGTTSTFNVNGSFGNEGEVLKIVNGYPAWSVNSITETDPKVGTLTQNYIPKWDGNSNSLIDGSLVDVNGNIGIGTTNPQTKLQIYQSTFNNWDGLSFTDPNANRWNLYKGTSSANQLFFNFNGSSLATFYPSGSLALGSTISNITSLNRAITLSATTYSNNPVGLELIGGQNGGSAEIGRVSFIQLLTSTENARIQTLTGSGNTTYGQLLFSTRNSSGLNEAMRINIDGNIGIGTTNPTSKLTVAGGNALFNGNVSIGSSEASYKLYVEGDLLGTNTITASQGFKTGGEYNYTTAPTRYLTLNPYDFVKRAGGDIPTNDGVEMYNYLFSTISEPYLYFSGSITASSFRRAVAPVRLPDGASISSLTFNLFDGGNSNINVTFEKMPYNSNGVAPTVIASATSSVSTGVQALTLTPTGETINNASFSYYVVVSIPSVTSTLFNSTYRLKDVQIKYSVSKAD
jgi:hypothetical protein